MVDHHCNSFALIAFLTRCFPPGDPRTGDSPKCVARNANCQKAFGMMSLAEIQKAAGASSVVTEKLYQSCYVSSQRKCLAVESDDGDER